MPDAGAFLGAAFAGGPLAAAGFVVGVLLALGGLWMLVRRGPPSPPVALAVLLAGAALVALPRLPGRAGPDGEAPAPPALPEGLAVTREAGRTVAAALPARPPPLPGREAAVIAIEGAEVEPNDSLAAANRAALGTAVSGRVAAGDSDCFAFDVPAAARGAVVANLTVGDAAAALALLDDAGQTLGIATTFDALAMRKATLERPLVAGRYYVIVRGIDAPTDYQLTLAVRRR